jgi:hypothetical protein
VTEGRRLPAGRYRLIVTASDRGGRTRTKRLSFRVA